MCVTLLSQLCSKASSPHTCHPSSCRLPVGGPAHLQAGVGPAALLVVKGAVLSSCQTAAGTAAQGRLRPRRPREPGLPTCLQPKSLDVVTCFLATWGSGTGQGPSQGLFIEGRPTCPIA